MLEKCDQYVNVGPINIIASNSSGDNIVKIQWELPKYILTGTRTSLTVTGIGQLLAVAECAVEKPALFDDLKFELSTSGDDGSRSQPPALSPTAYRGTRRGYSGTAKRARVHS